MLLMGWGLGVMLASVAPFAARAQGDVTCRELTYPSQGGTVPATLCLPGGPVTPRPGVIYLHGSGGPNEAPPQPYGGIGARLEGNPLRVGAVFPDAPAEAAGLQAGDRILAIDDLPASDLCLACLTGEYPTPWGERLYQVALEDRDRDDARRTYERVTSLHPPR